MEGFLDSVSTILFQRAMRDTDESPETWLERGIIPGGTNDWANPGRGRDEILVAMKMAELLDDRKIYLVREIREDIYRIENPGCIWTKVRYPDPGLGWPWWSEFDLVKDDMDYRVAVGYDDDGQVAIVCGSIRADSPEDADRILRGKIDAALREYVIL